MSSNSSWYIVGNSTPCEPPALDEFPEDFFTQSQRLQGGVIVHFLITIYGCVAMLVICDGYFIPSLAIISKHLGISSDVSGATLMALGSSSSELFSSLVSVFVAKSNLGIGTVVGSAVFNLLGVTCVSGLVLRSKRVFLDWYPITRESFAYIISVGALVAVVWDEKVEWWEAAILLVLYVLYIVFLVFNNKIERLFKDNFKYSPGLTETPSIDQTDGLGSGTLSYLSRRSRKIKYSISHIDELDGHSSEHDDELNPFKIPAEGGTWKKPCWFLMWPCTFLFYVTVPNSKIRRGLTVVTFIMSLLWMAIISYVCVWMVTIISYTLGISDEIAGLTILAAGVSVPELIFGVIGVQKGEGNLILSTQIGSNIFDILVCLALPWLISASAFSKTGSVDIDSSSLVYTIVMLFACSVIFWLILLLARWILDWKVGIFCLAFYLAFVVLACLYQLDVVGNFKNEAECGLP